MLIAVISSAPAQTDASDTSARDLYEKASRSVVFLIASSHSAGFSNSGAGSIVFDGQFVITSAHVVVEGGRVADSVRVFYRPAQLSGLVERDLVSPVMAKVVSYDERVDVALLRLADKASAPSLTLATRPLSTGDTTLTIGHPEDGGPWSMTDGIVSNRIVALAGVPGKDVYQIQTPINPGNSGGPLLASNGEIVGLATSAPRIGKSGANISGVHFALTSLAVLRFLSRSGSAVGIAPAERASRVLNMSAAAPVMRSRFRPTAPNERPRSRPYSARDVTARWAAARTHAEAGFNELDQSSTAH